MTRRKQPSGYQNRKKRQAKLAAASVLVPQLKLLSALEGASSLNSLTSARLLGLRNWLEKQLSTDDFAVLLKTLAEFRADIVARIKEREVEADERALAKLEELEANQATVPTFEYIPTPPGPIGGELMPRDTNETEVTE